MSRKDYYCQDSTLLNIKKMIRSQYFLICDFPTFMYDPEKIHLGTLKNWTKSCISTRVAALGTQLTPTCGKLMDRMQCNICGLMKNLEDHCFFFFFLHISSVFIGSFLSRICTAALAPKKSRRNAHSFKNTAKLGTLKGIFVSLYPYEFMPNLISHPCSILFTQFWYPFFRFKL